MESTNLHHLQDQPPPSAEPPSSLSSCYGGGVVQMSHSANWNTTPNITLNGGSFNHLNLQEANHGVLNKNIKATSSMIQDLCYPQWISSSSSSDAGNYLTTPNQSNFSKIIKEEISVSLPEMLMEGYGGVHDATNSTKDEHKDMNALNEKLLLKTLFSSSRDLYYSPSTTSSSSSSAPDQNYPNFGVPIGRGNFSQIYPSINISNLNQSSLTSTAISTTSLDLLTPAAGLGCFNDHNLSFRIDHNDSSLSSNSANFPSHFTNGTPETKRACTLMESKASQSQTASKKSRSESRPSCPPIKVRKEKLGDRIAALQQLVAPFGKTDTASVLMEAIGYIKFLQGQVETLSVPYMKSSNNQTNRVMMQRGSAIGDANGEPKQDLRSRGLCLVPLSCMSYIAGDGGSEVWQHPNFGGPT